MAKDENMNDSLNDAAVISAFKDKTKEKFHDLDGMDPDMIEANVRMVVEDIIKDYSLDVTIEDVVISGSRSRGIESAGSDLDVVVYFSGSEREDSFFNILHENGIVMGGAKVDINPISQGQIGCLSEYLKGVDAYLEEKQSQMAREAEQAQEKVITYTVAECGEFHSRGEFHRYIATIEEAKALYDAILPEQKSMIPSVGINVHTVGTKAMDDIQCDILYGKTIDLDDMRFIPEIWNVQDAISKVGQLIEAFPDAEVVGKLPGIEVQGRQTTDVSVDMDSLKPVYVDEAAKLAAEIDRFSSDRDPSEYKDTVDNWEAQVQNMAAEIRSGYAGDYKRYLADVVSESDNIEDVRKAAELLIKLAEYKPLAKVEELEEENLNQIDNYLSNTVSKAEERREIRNAEQDRIKEEERKRRVRGERPSLRARLAQKKAIVAAAGKHSQREKQRQVQHKPLASQRDNGERM